MKKNQNGFGIVELLLIIVVISLLIGAGYLVWNSQKERAGSSTANNKDNSNKNNENPSKYLEIPELGVKIADPQNRGIKTFFDASSSTSKSVCEDGNLDTLCAYYVYDKTTYQGTYPNGNSAEYSKYYKCNSDLTIYEISAKTHESAMNSVSKPEPGYTADVKLGDRYISLWAHGAGRDECSGQESSNVNTNIKDLLQYVKANVSLL